MKIYITGSVASGKSTLARRLSNLSGVPCHHLDDVVYEKDPTGEWGNRKRRSEVRDALFAEILAGDYIIEDTGRVCFLEGMRQAEQIIVLEIPLRVRYRRILLRHLKQVLGVEKSTYRPSLKMVRSMFRWAKNFDTGADGVKVRIAPFAEKTVTLHSEKEIKAFLERFK